MDSVKVEIGDTVQVPKYQEQSMDGRWGDGYLSDAIGIVTGFAKDYEWRSQPNMATLRILSKDGGTWNASWQAENLVVITKGTGVFELGVTHPFCEKELKAQRWTAFEAQLLAVDLRHDGFSNAATFLAWLYLNQESRVHSALPQLRRKDGTINPNKIKKLAEQHQITVDDWATEPPLEFPAEFVYYRNPIERAQCINWAEVAASFSQETAAA